MATQQEAMVGELLVKASHVILQARTHGHVLSVPVKDGESVAKSWVRRAPGTGLANNAGPCLEPSCP